MPLEGTELNGGQALIKSLELEGVEVIFGYPGGAILPVYDPIIDSSIRHVLVRHEQGAGHMAEGYAHATGRPGVCMVTSGPAATNVVTPLADAYLDSVPLVCITGQVAMSAIGTDAFQECDTHRHHPFGHEAQHARHRRRRHPRCDRRGVPHRHQRSAGSGSGRHPEEHRRRQQSRRLLHLHPPPGDLAPGLQPGPRARTRLDRSCGGADVGRRATGALRGRRRAEGTGSRGAPPARRDR